MDDIGRKVQSPPNLHVSYLAGVTTEEVDASGQLVAVVHLGLCERKQYLIERICVDEELSYCVRAEGGMAPKRRQLSLSST